MSVAPPRARPGSADPALALADLAAELRGEGPAVAPHVADPRERPGLGLLAAAGPRCQADPAAYAAVIESVREGYLLHYGTPRILAAADPDLRLLVGDHLYARGIERLMDLGDLLAVRELSTLISLVARLHAASEPEAAVERSAAIAWLAATVAVAAGPGEDHAAAVEELRGGGSAQPLFAAASGRAREAGLAEVLTGASETVGFRPDLG